METTIRLGESEIREGLKKFWKSTTTQIQKNICTQVCWLVSMSGNSLNFLEHVRNTVINETPDFLEINTLIDGIYQLDPTTRDEISKELLNYLILKHSQEKTPE